MPHRHSEETRQGIIRQISSGHSITAISRETGVARSTIYAWIAQSSKAIRENSGSAMSPNDVRLLKRRLLKYQNMISVLQSVNCSVASPTQEKLEALESLYGQYEVHTLCEALCVPRGTFYNHIFRGKHGNTLNAKRREELRVIIREIFDEFNQLFGAGKITAILRERGFITSEKLVSELMAEMGLQSVSTNAKRTYVKWQKGESRNLLRQQFHVEEPNHVWVSDVTAFRYNDVYFYICAIIDLYSRKVVAYRISKNNSTQLITSAFRQAQKERQPSGELIFHSDRGVQFTSFSFTKLLRDSNVVQSFSRSGCPHDNAVMEAFFSYLKKEELYRHRYSSEKEFIKGVAEYMKFYNSRRPHGALHYKAPVSFEETAILQSNS